MAPAVRYGDVIEFVTPRGLAYAQYTHDDPSHHGMGQLLRVLPGLFEIRPANMSALVLQREQYWSFSNLPRWLREEDAEVVSNEDVPAHSRDFPIMRARGLPDATGNPYWWLIDAEGERPLGALREKHRHLSIAHVPTYGAFITDLANGYTPAADSGSSTVPPTQGDASKSRTASHYLYFRNCRDAQAALADAEGSGYEGEVKESADPAWPWLLLVGTAAASPEEAEVQGQELTNLAESRDGDYDGLELGLKQ